MAHRIERNLQTEWNPKQKHNPILHKKREGKLKIYT